MFFHFIILLNCVFFQRCYISLTRVEIFLTKVEIFHIIAVFFNSVYWVEISNRDKNLHIIIIRLVVISCMYKLFLQIKKANKAVSRTKLASFFLVNNFVNEIINKLSSLRSPGVKLGNQFRSVWKLGFIMRRMLLSWAL